MRPHCTVISLLKTADKGKEHSECKFSKYLAHINQCKDRQQPPSHACWLLLYRLLFILQKATCFTHSKQLTPLDITNYIDLNIGTLFYLTTITSHFLSAQLKHTSAGNEQRVCHKWRCVVCLCASLDSLISDHEDNTSMETSLTSIPRSHGHIPEDLNPGCVLSDDLLSPYFLPQITEFSNANSIFVAFSISNIIFN